MNNLTAKPLLSEKHFWMMVGLFVASALMMFSPEIFAKQASDITKAEDMKNLFEWGQDVLGYGLILLGSYALLRGTYEVVQKQDLVAGCKCGVATVMAGGLGGKITFSATLMLF